MTNAKAKAQPSVALQRLAGRHALLTGVAGGIGLSVLRAYLREGARCTAVDLAAEPQTYPESLHCVVADVASQDSIDQMVQAAVIRYTQSAALAMAPHQIRVNGMAPGVIDTPMWGKVDALFARYGRVLRQRRVALHHRANAQRRRRQLDELNPFVPVTPVTPVTPSH